MYFVTEGKTLVIIIKGFKKKGQKQEHASLDRCVGYQRFETVFSKEKVI